jgi:membrane-bound lytic murein transglycosylase D
MHGGRTTLITAAVVVLGLFAGSATLATPAPGLDPEHFPIPTVLEPNIGFWSDVYSLYTVDQVAIHDDRHLNVVYDVLDMSDLRRSGMSEGQQRRVRQDRVDAARERIVAALRRLSRSDPQSAEEERIYKLWAPIGAQHGRFEEASGRVRAQTGLRERFAEGLVIAGRYLPGIERVFEAERVPTILSRLPFVESMFVNRAQSKVGAVGAWQFMPGTARLYLQMNPAVDSRIDTILAAEGAARMLRHDYEELRSWPLALTAYNHGRAGVARAVREVGTRDLGQIVQNYSSRRFGFASRNFYAEFVAAATVHARYAELFPGVTPDPEIRFDQLEMAHYVSLLDLAEATGTDIEVLRGLNPALDHDVFAGTLLLPKTYRLRVPAGEFARFESAYGALPADRRRDSQLQAGYRVQQGDTVGAIARRFGTTVGAIQRANGLSRPDRIKVGQYLRIPGQSPQSHQRTMVASAPAPITATTEADATNDAAPILDRKPAVDPAGVRTVDVAVPADASAPTSTTHLVRRGETLALIARRYRVTVEEMVTANGLVSADRIFPGQRLKIPAIGAPAQPVAAPVDVEASPAVEATVADVGASSEPARQHVVRRGDSLTGIARRYSVSVEAIRSRNELGSSVIHPGQVLEIP